MDLSGFYQRTTGPLGASHPLLNCRHWLLPRLVSAHQLLNSMQVLYTSTVLLTSLIIAHCLDLAVTAYMFRFITNSKKPKQKRVTGPLTPSEQHIALTTWVKQCQEEIYSRELMSLTNSTKRLPLVRQLRLFVDKEHLLRCGGRIHNAPLSETAKFPLLIPPKHWLTSLIIHSVHVQLFHAGTNATLTAIRQRFWIPTARQRIKSQLCHV